MGLIDSHQHYWDVTNTFPADDLPWALGALRYGWKEAGLDLLNRTFLPADLEPEMRVHGVQHTILANALHSRAETRWMLGLAETHESVAGVIGWVNLAQPVERVRLDIASIQETKLVAVRHILQFEPDQEWVLREDVIEGLRAVATMGLAYDLLINPAQLSLVPRLSDLIPELRMVIDHVAKPNIKNGAIQPWAAGIKAAAENSQVYCKLSGMVTEADLQTWKSKDLLPFVDVALEAFGTDRVMFGSDWPVCTLAAEYVDVYRALSVNLNEILGTVPESITNAIFHDNAARFYGLMDLSERGTQAENHD
jgi:L-fuconolactonase